MKKLFILSLLIFASCANKKEIKQVAEVSCGQCQFGIEGQAGCDLAVRLDGKAYFIDGAHIDDYGDAHDKTTWFCEVIRKAEVIGTIEENRFKANSVKMVD